MTLRRLYVLIQALPPDALLWAEVHAAVEKAKKAKPDLIRDRQSAFQRRNNRAKEAAS